MGSPSGLALSVAAAAAARKPATAASVPVFLKNSRREIADINVSCLLKLRASLRLSSPDVLVLDGAREAAGLSRRRPLEPNGGRFFPTGLGRVRRVIHHIANLLAVQPDLQVRPSEADSKMVPVRFLADRRELVAVF